MRLGNIDGRAAVLVAGRSHDLERASGGRLPSDPMAAVARWREVRDWLSTAEPGDDSVVSGTLEAPVPAPRQVFGIGVNYADHAAEAGHDAPASPMVFPKFASCITRPEAEVACPSPTMDWEVELVVVVGDACEDVDPADAWDHVAGLMVGQDLSDRDLQFAEPHPPQFGLGKSRPGFGPIGPWVVSPDELEDRDALGIRCRLNGEVVQESNTRHLIHGVAAVVSHLSRHVRLLPGDLVFTGTPSGVGLARTPPRFLGPGDVLVSEVDGIGSITTTIVESGRTS